MVNSLPAGFFDNNGLPSVAYIRNKKWKTIVFPDFINAIEAEWLAEYFLGVGFDVLYGALVDGDGDEEVKNLKCERDEVLKFCSENSFLRMVLSDEEMSHGFFFKDEGNRFFLLSGDEEFIERCCKYSLDTARLMFHAWVESVCNDVERGFMAMVWKKYTAR